MKRLFAFAAAVITALMLTACAVPTRSETTRKNELGKAFSASAHIIIGKLDAQGDIQRFGDGMWSVEFSSPNTLSGVKLSFSEGETNASYKGLEFSVPQSALPVKSMMLNLIAAVDSNARLDELKGVENGDILEINGSLDGGDYVLSVDKDGRLCGFSMPNNELTMTFTDMAVSEPSFPGTAPTKDDTAASTECLAEN